MNAELDSRPAMATAAAAEPTGTLLALPQPIIETLPVAVYACDAAGRVLWFNQRAADLWGRSPRIGDDSELFCGSYKLHFGGRQIARHETPMAHVLRSGEPIHDVEGLMERPDGSQVWVTVHIDPVRDPAGHAIGAINCFTDTTALHQAQSQLHERDAHVRNLLQALPVPIYTTDEAGWITDFNEAAVEFAGRTPTPGLDKCIIWKLRHADGSPMPHNECPMSQALREDRAFDYAEVAEAIAERPDGTRRWFMSYPTPLHDGSGKLTGGINMVLDITRRKRNELLLAEQTAVLEMAAKGRGLAECLSALTASVARLDPDSRACVLLADAPREAFAEAYSASLPDTFGNNVQDARIEEWAIGTCGTAVWSGQPVTCTDIEHDARWAQPWRELCLAHGIHAVHSTPIFDEFGRSIGSFMLAFGRTGAPNDWHLRIAEFGAHVASIAIAKHRAEGAARSSAADLAEDLADAHLLQTISTEMLSETDPDALYSRIVDAASTLMRSDFASLQMLHSVAGGHELRLLAHRGFDDRAARNWARVHRDSRTTCAVAMQQQRRIIAGDVRDCTDLFGEAGTADYARAGILAVQTTPLFARSGKLVGMLSTHWRKPHQPPARRLGLLDVLCRQAADLIETRAAEQALIELNVSLERRVSERTAELERSERELRRVASMLNMAEHAERRRISQVLHDDLQQQLHSIQMKLAGARAAIERGDRTASIRHLDTAEAWCGEGVDITRRLTVDLSPPILKSEGLTEALGWLITQMREMHGLEVTIRGDRELPMPDDATRVLIYQIVRELLFNIVKHAGTDRGYVELHQRGAMLEICVLDEGRGFDPATMQQVPRTGRAGGFGMASAGERLAMLGGSMEIDSAPGRGTRVTLRVPAVALHGKSAPMVAIELTR